MAGVNWGQRDGKNIKEQSKIGAEGPDNHPLEEESYGNRCEGEKYQF